jgi:hypothetical protein
MRYLIVFPRPRFSAANQAEKPFSPLLSSLAKPKTIPIVLLALLS